MKALFLILSLFLTMSASVKADKVDVTDVYTNSGENIFVRSVVPTVKVTVDYTIMEMALLFSHNVGNVTIRILAANGAVYWCNNMETAMKNCSVDLTELSKGDYTIEIKDENDQHYWIGSFQL